MSTFCLGAKSQVIRNGYTILLIRKKKVVDGFLEHISSNRRGPHALLERDYYISMYLLEQIHTSDKENTS